MAQEKVTFVGDQGVFELKLIPMRDVFPLWLAAMTEDPRARWFWSGVRGVLKHVGNKRKEDNSLECPFCAKHMLRIEDIAAIGLLMLIDAPTDALVNTGILVCIPCFKHLGHKGTVDGIIERLREMLGVDNLRRLDSTISKEQGTA